MNMAFTILPELEEKILRQYERNMACYPKKLTEVEQWLQDKDTCYSLCLKFLYGHLPIIDIVSFSVETIGAYVSASLEAYERIDYVRTIPQDVFLTYIVSHRVNSECLDGSRKILMEQILPLVQGKNMYDAALAVNYWCYSQATYTPADDRTLGPLSIMRRTLGRCGEESVLCVAAMRSVGIPARQCYAPRWSHCDDNHAWVEVWIDGTWHYMGACEPEPILNKGWFTAASSRAMLVHTKAWSDFEVSHNVAYNTPLYCLVNCTATYADTKLLKVQVLENGKPLAGVNVAFQIDNYSELFSLYDCNTDENGEAVFETGLGDLCVYVYHAGKICLEKVDMRLTDRLTLDVANGFTLETAPERMSIDFVPPIGKSDVVADVEDPVHDEKMRQCEATRMGFKATFWQEDDGSVSHMALRESAGNFPEIQRFLADPRYTRFQKEQILSTLRTKDFVDITCDVLFEALELSEPVRQQYPEEIFRDYILAPRVADEMLLAERAKIRQLFPEGFRNAEEVLSWMKEHMQTLPDYDVDNYFPSTYGCLYYKQTADYGFDMVFVSLCRAFCIPARLAPDTREGQWLDAAGVWHTIRLQEQVETVTLTVVNNTGKALNYFEHFSIGYWNGTGFDSLQHWDLSMQERCDFHVRPGYYRMITTTRQIDGTASVLMRHLYITKDCSVEIEMPLDQTAQRLKQEPLLPLLPDGPVKSYLNETLSRRRILVFADPGSEPTEHLLQEMLECKEEFNRQDCDICVFLRKDSERNDPTLRKVCASIGAVQTRVCHDPEAVAALHRIMQVGDLRLPFVISVNQLDRGVYATANYNIRMAQTLLMIHKLIAGGK